MNKRQFLQLAGVSALGLAGYPVLAQGSKQGATQSLTGKDDQDKPVSLNDYTGKACLISFFTAGCNLCSNDLKLMREFYVGNKARNFILLGVNLDERKEDFLQYMRLIMLSIPADQRFPIVWRNAPGHQDTFGTILKKPTHFVLDKAHKLVLRREGTFQPSDWDDLWTSLS